MYNVRRNRFRRVAAAKLLPALLMSGVLATFITTGPAGHQSHDRMSGRTGCRLGLIYTCYSLPLRELAAHDSWQTMIGTLRKAANAPLF